MTGQDQFDLGKLSRLITQRRAERSVTWNELSAATGVAVSTIRRFETAADAEADGVLALVGWVECVPEEFIAGSSVTGALLPPAGDGQIRVDMRLLVGLPGSKRRSKNATRTTIQTLTAEAQRSGSAIASLVRWSPV